VIVEASTNKGSIIQVQILVDGEVIESRTESPYHFTIPPYTVPVGMRTLSAEAYSSERNLEVDAMLIKIKEAK